MFSPANLLTTCAPLTTFGLVVYVCFVVTFRSCMQTCLSRTGKYTYSHHYFKQDHVAREVEVKLAPLIPRISKHEASQLPVGADQADAMRPACNSSLSVGRVIIRVPHPFQP